MKKKVKMLLYLRRAKWTIWTDWTIWALWIEN